MFVAQQASRFSDLHELSGLESSRFHATASEMTFEYDLLEPGQPKRHHVVRVRTESLDPKAIRNSGVGYIFISCKNKTRCVSDSVPPDSWDFGVGPISAAHVGEAEQYLRRLLLLNSGQALPKVVHPASEAQILAFLRKNISSTTQFGNMAVSRRLILVEGDNLIEAQDLMDMTTGQRGHLIVTIPLSQLYTVTSNGTNVALVCDLSSTQDNLKKCISDNVGDESSDVVISGVSNGQQVAKMIKQLIRLHAPDRY